MRRARVSRAVWWHLRWTVLIVLAVPWLRIVRLFRFLHWFNPLLSVKTTGCLLTTSRVRWTRMASQHIFTTGCK